MWMPAVGAALAVVLVSVFFLWIRVRPAPREAPAAATAEIPVREEIAVLVRRVGLAEKPDDFLPLIREPERFAGEVRAWCGAAPVRLPMTGELVDAGPVRESRGHSLLTATATFTERKLVQLLFVKTTAGWRLDWRAFVQRGDLTVGEFMEQRPASPALVYVVAQRSSYHNGPYADPEIWLSLRVCDASGQHVFYAAVPRSDAAAMQALADLPETAGREGVDLARHARRKALRLRWGHPDLPLPQAEVTAVEGDGWFVP